MRTVLGRASRKPGDSNFKKNVQNEGSVIPMVKSLVIAATAAASVLFATLAAQASVGIATKAASVEQPGVQSVGCVWVTVDGQRMCIAPLMR